MLSVTCAGSRSKLADLSDSPLLLWAVIQSLMCSLRTGSGLTDGQPRNCGCQKPAIMFPIVCPAQATRKPFLVEEAGSGEAGVVVAPIGRWFRVLCLTIKKKSSISTVSLIPSASVSSA
jgi:hypothetical protein